MVSAKTLLVQLPAFRDQWVLIKEDQKVKDIIAQILAAHDKYAGYYDKIALYFDADTTQGICQNLYDFLKREVKYREEPDSDQTTALPAGILTRGEGDCKHYASFCGGVLDALNRAGKKIKWAYRFASYNALQKTPHHVFVVVFDRDKEIWIDPVPGANKLTPVWMLDKKIKAAPMALYDNIGSIAFDPNVSLTNQLQLADFDSEYRRQLTLPYEVTAPFLQQAPDYYTDPVPDLDDNEIPADVLAALQVLINYGVVTDAGDIDMGKVIYLTGQLPYEQSAELTNALDMVNNAKISGLFSSIWRGAKKVTMAGPRGAFLALVGLNVFGMATKMKQATKTQDGINKVRNKWYKLGGDWAKLRSAIDNGSQRKRIGGIGAAPAIPAWVAVASAIIAAIMPLVNAILKQQRASGMDMTPYIDEYGGGNPYGNTPTGGGIIDWLKANPIPAAGIGVVLVNFLLPKNKRFF